jgi:transcriptional antiterminator NusG
VAEKVQEYKWYVLRVISGQEKKVKTGIESELKFTGFGDRVKQILIPMEKVMQLRKGKKVTKERNYYPGYIMLEADLVGEMQHVIKSVQGVVGFLGSKDHPEALRPAEINRMLGKMDALNEASESVEVPFMIGEPVKVIDGPFNGFTGVIEEINEEKKKLKVIVKIFGRRTPVELNYLQVEKE